MHQFRDTGVGISKRVFDAECGLAGSATSGKGATWSVQHELQHVVLSRLHEKAIHGVWAGVWQRFPRYCCHISQWYWTLHRRRLYLRRLAVRPNPRRAAHDRQAVQVAPLVNERAVGLRVGLVSQSPESGRTASKTKSPAKFLLDSPAD
jgi:hypothetical protein